MATVPIVDRPREKLARVGAVSLGDNELVALVLGTGTRSRGALVVAQDVIALAGGVPGLVRMAPDELDRVPGVGASVDGLLRGVLRAFAAVDGVAERLPIVAGGNRVFRSLERIDRRGEFGRGERVGARGACRVDCALRLVHFFAGRFGAAG